MNEKTQIKKKHRKSLSVGIVINIFAFTLLKGFAFFSSPYITRVLETSDYGNMSAYNIWRDVVCVVAGLGISSSLVIYKNKSNNRDYKKYCWNGLLVGLFSHTGVFVIAFLLRDYISKLLKLPNWLIPIIVVSAFCQFAASYFSTYLIIDNQALHNMILSLLITVGGFFTGVFLSHISFFENGLMYVAFILGYTIIDCLICVYIIIYFGILGHGFINSEFTLFSLRIGVPMIFHYLAGTVLVSSDRIMIKDMISDGESGLYAYSYNFANILYCVWSAINSIWGPYYMKYIRDKDVDNLIKKKKNFDVLFVCLYIGFVMVFEEVYKLIANDRYWDSISIVPIIALAFVFNHLYSFPQGHESFKEKTTYIALGTFGASAINVFLNLFFIPLWGMYGAALSTLISYLVFYLLHRFLATRIIGDYLLEKYSDRYIIYLSLITFGLYYVLKPYWIARWGIAFIAGFIILFNCKKNHSII